MIMWIRVKFPDYLMQREFLGKSRWRAVLNTASILAGYKPRF
jgi:hypothetical protein